MPYKRLSNHRGRDIKIILWSINSSNTPAWTNKTYSSSIIWWSILQNCTLIFFCLKPTRIIHIIDHFFLLVWLPLFWIKCFKLRDKTNSRSFKLFVIKSRICQPFLLFCKSEGKNTLGLFSSKFIRCDIRLFCSENPISWIDKVTAIKRKRGRDQSKWVPLTTWSSPSSIPRGRIDFHFYTFQKKV